MRRLIVTAVLLTAITTGTAHATPSVYDLLSGLDQKLGLSGAGSFAADAASYRMVANPTLWQGIQFPVTAQPLLISGSSRSTTIPRDYFYAASPNGTNENYLLNYASLTGVPINGQSNPFVFLIKRNDNPFGPLNNPSFDATWYSDPALNVDHAVHMLALEYEGPLNIASDYLLFFDDQPITGASTYLSTVVEVRNVEDVPEPVALGVLGFGLATLGLVRRKA